MPTHTQTQSINKHTTNNKNHINNQKPNQKASNNKSQQSNRKPTTQNPIQTTKPTNVNTQPTIKQK